MTRSLYLKMLHWYGLGHKAPSAVAGPPCRWPGDRRLPARLNEPRVEASALRGRTGCEWGLPNNHYSPPLGICKNDLWQICLISMDVGLWIPSLDRPPPPLFLFFTCKCVRGHMYKENSGWTQVFVCVSVSTMASGCTPERKDVIDPHRTWQTARRLKQVIQVWTPDKKKRLAFFIYHKFDQREKKSLLCCPLWGFFHFHFI